MLDYSRKFWIPVLNAQCTLFFLVLVEILWNDRPKQGKDEYDGTHNTVGETSAIALSQRLPAWGNITCKTIVILLALWVAWYFYNYIFYQQVKMLMEQCWAAEPEQRPLFSSLIEKFEAIRRTYDWQSNINFSLAQICWAQLLRSTRPCIITLPLW